MNWIPRDLNISFGNVTIRNVDGELHTIIVVGQWTFDFWGDNYLIANFGPDGVKRYFQIEKGPYGPVIRAEPDLAFDAPDNLQYVNAKGEPSVPEEKIAGIMCDEGLRASLTNAKSKGIEIKLNDDGSLSIGGEIWWIYKLLRKDKGRIIGYDAKFQRVKPVNVVIKELEDFD